MQRLPSASNNNNNKKTKQLSFVLSDLSLTHLDDRERLSAAFKAKDKRADGFLLATRGRRHERRAKRR